MIETIAIVISVIISVGGVIYSAITRLNHVEHNTAEINNLRTDFNEHKNTIFARIDDLKKVDEEQGKTLARIDERTIGIENRLERMENKSNGIK